MVDLEILEENNPSGPSSIDMIQCFVAFVKNSRSNARGNSEQVNI